ncbi:hypothetical protein [Pontiella desulfatans]|uniref:hypothetical protein n=1 Tax=Pontiella desulfatans TaxID=2750659 RepID=UPI0014442389|nr:hypothetical protein [Pontiella desulfatans]
MYGKQTYYAGVKNELKLDRSVLSVVSLHAAGDDKAYWQSRSPEERLQAIQMNRQAAYGKPSATGRLQRILEVAKRS